MDDWLVFSTPGPLFCKIIVKNNTVAMSSDWFMLWKIYSKWAPVVQSYSILGWVFFSPQQTDFKSWFKLSHLCLYLNLEACNFLYQFEGCQNSLRRKINNFVTFTAGECEWMEASGRSNLKKQILMISPAKQEKKEIKSLEQAYSNLIIYVFKM